MHQLIVELLCYAIAANKFNILSHTVGLLPFVSEDLCQILSRMLS